MYISDTHQAVYIAPVNTASTSIGAFLVANYGFEEKTNRHDHRLSSVVEKYGQEYATQVSGYTVIMSCRDPFDRVLAIWNRIKEYQNEGMGYGLRWTTFTEFAMYLNIYQSLPNLSEVTGVENKGSRWDSGISRAVFLTAPLREIFNNAVSDFGSVDYLLNFADIVTLESIPFITPPVILPPANETSISDLSDYDTEQNRSLINTWDQGVIL